MLVGANSVPEFSADKNCRYVWEQDRAYPCDSAHLLRRCPHCVLGPPGCHLSEGWIEGSALPPGNPQRMTLSI